MSQGAAFARKNAAVPANARNIADLVSEISAVTPSRSGSSAIDCIGITSPHVCKHVRRSFKARTMTSFHLTAHAEHRRCEEPIWIEAIACTLKAFGGTRLSDVSSVFSIDIGLQESVAC